MSKPKLLVTGLSGLLGSRIQSIASRWFDLVNLDITEGIDITNRDQFYEAVQSHPDAKVLVHLAAFTDVSRAYAQTDDKEGPCYRINVIGTENVAWACSQNDLHLIHISTDFVFDGRKEGSYVETDMPNPIEWYGRTKWMAEEAARRTNDRTIIRLAFPYVAGPAPRPDVIQNIYNKLLEGQELNLFTDQITTPTFADDIANGIAALARVRPAGELFHLVGSSSLTPFDLGLKIARVFNFDESKIHPSSIEEYMKKDPRPRHRRLQLSNAKWTAFAQRQGLNKPLTIDEGLARVVQAQPAPTKK